MSATEYVRICPVCDRENAPTLARCACGASLAGIDFSLRRRATPDNAPASESSDELHDGADMPTPPTAATPLPPVLELATGTASASPAICPHADCAQPNPAGRERCVYCNRPLRVEAQRDAIHAGIRPLPSALRSDYRVVEAFPATGSEADLLLVEHLPTGEQCVAKLYRKGLAPDERLLALLASEESDAVVRVRAHGVSDGVAYEIQEYLRHGTLRELLSSGPLPGSDVRRIVKELADALNGIHARRILHRDLKPENVLVRSRAPLELALSDFGIASLREATQHFTGGARTAKYAAPEALTGVLDDKSDWWALGMIALEAVTGRHPFDGLSEQVINHRLATRPVDVRSVYDDALRTLCRGLLLRDPKRRWGRDEVARWLAGDPSLVAPEDSDGYAVAARPYRIGQVECTNAAQLAVALARDWDAGAKDLARGQIARWIEHELHDYNLVRKLRDVSERRGISDDMRLLLFLLLAAPDLPPVWRGEPVSLDSLLAAARKSDVEASSAAARWIDSIAKEEVLAEFGARGHRDLAEIGQRWCEATERFQEIWRTTQTAELAWRRQAKAAVNPVPDVDEMIYASPLTQVPPRQDRLNGLVLLMSFENGHAETVRGEVLTAQAGIAGLCSWFDALIDAIGRDPMVALVAQEMLPQARDDADIERRRQRATQSQRERAIAETREALRSQLDDIGRLVAADKRLRAETIARLFSALERFQQTCLHALSLGYTDPDYLALRRGAEKLSSHAVTAQQDLARCEELQGMYAIVLRPERLAMAGMVAVGIIASRVPWLILALILVVGCVVSYGWYRRAMATHAAKRSLRWLQLHAKTIDPSP